ncbi:hypothetical protein [Endozoicomonas sp. SESOKO1]|uniref:hypothetical protein n=1 Tax=Endozoicomonas sp. SESOKO1 TaxID=2828742 RepID=UPI0021493D13|nr:hypothetical protein [Endozoicomonas sp. SESOKO1]
MGICAKELRHYVVRPALKHLDMWSPTGENLLLGTAAIESGLGFHLKLANHQALGIYQISPRMHRNIWDFFLAPHAELSSKVRGLASQREFLSHPHHELATNLVYATAIAWLIYHRSGIQIEAIDKEDITAMGRLWQKRFHSRNPGTIQSFCESYQTMIIESGSSTEESEYFNQTSARPA